MAIRRTSFPAISPSDPLSTNDELVLCLCSDTLYVMCILHCRYLIPSIVTVVLLVDVGSPFWLVELLLLVVDNILHISAGWVLLSWSDIAFARRVVLLSLGVSLACAVGYVSLLLLIYPNIDMSRSIDLCCP